MNHGGPSEATARAADAGAATEVPGARRLRVLFLAHRIPYPPDKGDKIRSYHLLVNLARQHDVDLVTHVDDPRDLRHREVLADMCASVHVFPLNPMVGALRTACALPLGRSLSVAWMTRPGPARVVKELLATRAHDVVVGYSSQVVAYLPRTGTPPLVLDYVDVDSEKFVGYADEKGPVRGFIDRLESRRLRAFERRAAERAARVVVTTRQGGGIFRDRVLERHVDHVTNGAPFPDVVPDPASRDPRLMIFVGTMDYPPNVAAVQIAAREVLPLVRQTVPDARFRIVGRHPTREVRALADLPGVEVTGEVPDMREHLRAAALSIVPLRVARGVQTKVLESLAHAIPLIATPNVFSCLEEGADGAVLVAPDAAGLAAHAVRLLTDPAERTRVGEAGRRYVAARHDWRVIDRFWDGLIEEAVDRRSV